MRKLAFFIWESWLFIVALFIYGSMIAAANIAWQDRILYNTEVLKFSVVAQELFPEAMRFDLAIKNAEVDLGDSGISSNSITKAIAPGGYPLGWTFICEGWGYVDWIQLVVAVDADFETIQGYKVLMSYETPGYGDQIESPYFSTQFIGAPAEELYLSTYGDSEVIDSEIVAISGATISSESVVDMINVCLPQIKAMMQENGLISNDQ